MGAALLVLSALLPPELAVAVGIPLGALLYLALLRRFMPDGLHTLLVPLRAMIQRPEVGARAPAATPTAKGD